MTVRVCYISCVLGEHVHDERRDSVVVVAVHDVQPLLRRRLPFHSPPVPVLVLLGQFLIDYYCTWTLDDSL